MGWELLGGDPAPGSPDAIVSAVTALRQVSDLASDARSNLVAQTGAAGIQHWKGRAADAFRDDVQKLPDQLNVVTTSYREAARALSIFRDALDQSQMDARAALAAAQQAQADLDWARSHLNSATSELNALTSQHRSAQLKLTGLQAQQTLSIDPVHRASLISPIASARSQVSRLDGDISTTKQTVSRYEQAIKDAQARLDAARRQADGIRGTLSIAVDQAVAALKTAERDAHLPNWLQQHETELKQDLVTYGPAVIEGLKLGEELFSIAGTVFPPGAAIFKSAALICGAGVLLVSFATYAASPGGITKDDWMKLGEDTLDVAMMATGVAGASRLANASKFATASTWLGYADEAGDVALQTEEHGAKGFVVAAGAHVLGHVGEQAGGALIRQATATASKNKTVANALDAISQNVGHSKTTVFGVPLVSSADSRATQSLLLGGDDRGGQFIYGNSAATNPSVDDHMMGQDELTDLQNKTAGDLLSHALDKGEDALLPDQASEPEILIDLNPSPYGSSQ